MDEGIHGFDRRVREKAVRNVGDRISFIPSVNNLEYRRSFNTSPYLQHVAFDIYQLCFKATGLHFINCGAGDDDFYIYVIETYPKLKFCHTVYPHEFKKRSFELHQWYEGYGTISNRGFPESNMDEGLIDSLTLTSRIDDIYENHLWLDFGKHADRVKEYRYGNAYCYEDVLQWYGYYDDLSNFKANSSKLWKLARRFDTIKPESDTCSMIYNVTVL